MRNTAYILAVLLAGLLLPLAGWGDEGSPTKLRFRSGWVLAAEVRPVNSEDPIEVINVNEYDPPSKVISDVGYAAVTVSLDKGRSLGIYDYILTNGKGVEFSCVALQIENGKYDAGRWQIKDTMPDRRYTMLFKVQLPNAGKPEYYLRYILLEGKPQNLALAFRNVRSSFFTKPGSVPDEGIIGIDPEAEKKKAEAAKAAAEAEAKKAAGEEEKPETTEKTAEKTEKKEDADQPEE